MTLPIATRTRRMPRPTGVLSAVTALLATAALSTVVAATARAENPPGPHDPIGAVESIAVNPDGSVSARGWAADPDTLSANSTVIAVVDGRQRMGVRTSIARPVLARRYHTGPTPGFAITVPSYGSGTHTVCIAVVNSGVGVARVLRCVVTPSGAWVDPATRSPQGAVTSSSATPTTMSVSGRVVDPDMPTRRVTVVLYVDGSSAATILTHWVTTAAGRIGQFTASVPVSPGTHEGCIWAVNVGLGSNSSLGCVAVDTRGPAGTAPVSTPAVNKAVVAEAKKHIGQPYVWAAAGPKSFDCSGLVIYTYNKAGMANLPHQSELQFTMARLIPASRAVPGDLVFYHDTQGDVYHVGIYLSPGKTVAAIDESQGVNYQNIWDPSTATYGSLTHT
jgi:cell wall-associated NlpC family hydrolase